MEIDGKEVIQVNKVISANQEEIRYQFFDGKELYELKKSQFDEMKKSGRILI